MLNTENSVLLIIDIQEKLVRMLEKDTIVSKSCALANAARILGVDTIVTEQYPKGLGSTIDPLKEALGENVKYFEKTSFSALKEEAVENGIKLTGKKHVMICGIEAHICVYQTAMDLISKGYEVSLVADASASRNKFEFKTGVELMRQHGINITCVEIVLFELLKSSKNPDFKAVQALIK